VLFSLTPPKAIVSALAKHAQPSVHLYHFVCCLLKVRGAKATGTILGSFLVAAQLVPYSAGWFPTEPKYFRPLYSSLSLVAVTTSWEVAYVTLLWLSVLALLPFDMVLLVDETVGGAYSPTPLLIAFAALQHGSADIKLSR
jgi:hypothetical protein